MAVGRQFARALTVCLVMATSAIGADVSGLPRVGWLQWQSSGPYAVLTARGFEQGLRDEGFVEGRNVVLERRSAEGNIFLFRRLAADLAEKNVDVFFAPTKAMADAAWYAAGSKPIVIATIGDPVALKYIESLARPGTNVTGVTTASRELTAKRLELLARAVPGLRRVGVIIDDPMLRVCSQEIGFMEEAAAALGITLVRASINRKQDVEAAFRRFAESKVQAAMTSLLTTRHGTEREIIEAARRHSIPMMHELAEHAEMGGLIAYGPDFEDVFRRAGRYTGKLLKGANPATMALEEPREFRLVVNTSAARSIGIALPQELLLRADRVIE